MTVESAGDRLELLADFGVACKHTLASGLVKSLTGIFDNEFGEQLAGASVGIETQVPMITVRSADVTSAAHGDAIEVDAVDYKIRGIHPDGTGMTILVLEKQ